jgi:hypothetical protein
MSSSAPHIYPEEAVNPGYEPEWSKGAFDPQWWNVLPALNKILLREELWFRPRFAAALAMMRRKQFAFNVLNLPVAYHSEYGWYSTNVTLGHDSEWENPPTKDEAMTAYAIVNLVQHISGFGTAVEISGLARLGAYPDGDVIVLADHGEKWDESSWAKGERIYPFNTETAAILAVASMTPFHQLRDYYGFSFSSVGGPLVYNDKPKRNTADSPFPFWL